MFSYFRSEEIVGILSRVAFIVVFAVVGAILLFTNIA